MRIEDTSTEGITQQHWDSLFLRAQANVPYYLVAQSVLNTKSGDCKWYDGISFRKLHMVDPEMKDPLTQRTIVKVHYYLMKCFEFQLSSNGYTKTNLSFNEAQVSMFEVPSHFSKDVYAAEAINLFAAENPSDRDLVKKCQFITAMAMNDHNEQMRWLLSAEADLAEAKEALNRLSAIQI